MAATELSKFKTNLKNEFNKISKTGVKRETALQQIRSRLTKEGGVGTLGKIADITKSEGINKTKIEDPIDTTTGAPVSAGITKVDEVKKDEGKIEENKIIKDEGIIDEDKTIKEKIVEQIAGRKTREEELKAEKEEAGRGDLVDLQKGFAEEAVSVQEDLDNITAGLEAEGGAITKIAASRIREARSAPLRETLTALVKGQELTSANISEIDSSISAILEARELDKQDQVTNLSAQIESSTLSDEEKNNLLTQLGAQTEQSKQRDEIEAFRQKQQIMADIEAQDIESIETTGLTAEQNLQSAKIIQEFDVDEDSIAGESIRELIKEGQTPEQIRELLKLSTDETGAIDEEQFSRQKSLRTEFEGKDTVKNYLESVQQYKGVISTLGTATGVGDMTSIFQFMKVLDPSSVVRESEFDAASRSIGLGEQAKNFFSGDKLIEGSFLTEAGRSKFAQIAKILFDNRKDAFDKTAKQYINLALEAGINPGSVVLDIKNIPGASNLTNSDISNLNDDDNNEINSLFGESGGFTGSSGNSYSIPGIDGFNIGEKTSGTNIIPTEGFMEQLNINRTGTNVAKDTNNPGNITADSIPSGTTKEDYGKIIGATGTYLSPNGREYFVFPNVESGTGALKRDLTAKITGGSSVISPENTLAEFQRVYVGETSQNYLAVLKRITGTSENTQIKDIDAGLLTQAVMKAEGFIN